MSFLAVQKLKKKSYSYLFLHKQSCHSHNVLRGFIKVETIRQIRNLSDFNKLMNNLTTFELNFFHRGYDKFEIEDSITDAYQLPLLKYYNKTNQ